MIDIVYQLLKTIVNKELRGNITPAEFNLIAKQAQDRIFRGYFDDINRDKVKENKGLTSNNYANLPLFQRQRMDIFSETTTILNNTNPADYVVPSDVYFIKHNGLTYSGKVVQEMLVSDEPYLQLSLAASSETFPTYTQNGSQLIVSPSTVIGTLALSYFRIPKDPKWTYQIISNVEMFDNSNLDFQDFELHESEFVNIVIVMLSFFGVNLREADVTKYAELLKQKQDDKEEKLSI